MLLALLPPPPGAPPPPPPLALSPLNSSGVFPSGSSPRTLSSPFSSTSRLHGVKLQGGNGGGGGRGSGGRRESHHCRQSQSGQRTQTTQPGRRSRCGGAWAEEPGRRSRGGGGSCDRPAFYATWDATLLEELAAQVAFVALERRYVTCYVRGRVLFHFRFVTLRPSTSRRTRTPRS